LANEVDFLEKQISKHSQLKQEMEQGEAYFKQENIAIMNAKKEMAYDNGKTTVATENPFASNVKLPSGFFPQQVKQKVNYLINNEMTLSDQEDETFEIFPNLVKDLRSLGKKVSYKIYGAWQFYIEDGEVKYKVIDGDEIYPIFLSNSEKPDLIMRHYKDMTNEERAIIYSGKIKMVYVKEKNKWKYLGESPVMQNEITRNDEVIGAETIDLGMPPFAICYNNDLMETDLKPIKKQIDIYDRVDSDFANNIIDFQEIYYTLKNYGGQNIGEFMKQLKKWKTANLPSDGEIGYKQLKVPTEAKMTFLKKKRADIYENGMSVDINEIAAGNSTVIAIQAMFENLNFKLNDFEMEFMDFWEQVKTLTNKFNAIIGNGVVLDNKLQFDRSMLMNKLEKATIQKTQVETIGLLSGIFDDETLSKLALTLDIVKENIDIDKEELMKRLEAEKQSITLDE